MLFAALLLVWVIATIVVWLSFGWLAGLGAALVVPSLVGLVVGGVTRRGASCSSHSRC